MLIKIKIDLHYMNKKEEFINMELTCIIGFFYLRQPKSNGLIFHLTLPRCDKHQALLKNFETLIFDSEYHQTFFIV